MTHVAPALAGSVAFGAAAAFGAGGNSDGLSGDLGSSDHPAWSWVTARATAKTVGPRKRERGMGRSSFRGFTNCPGIRKQSGCGVKGKAGKVRSAMMVRESALRAAMRIPSAHPLDFTYAPRRARRRR